MKKIIFVFTLSFVIPGLLFAYDNKYVHPYIAEQAFLVWPRTSGHEIWQSLGNARGDKSCAESESGSTITKGSIEEDSYDPVGEVL